MRWYYLLAAFVALTPIVVWVLRRDYRLRGQYSMLGLVAVLVWFFIPHLALDVVTRYQLPRTPGELAGAGLAVAGLAYCVAAMVAFWSLKKVFGFGPGKLTLSGPYRWSRNPQYVGWFLFIVGFAVMWWTWECLFALGMLAVAIHTLVLAEEEHLRRVFGEDYVELCRRTPRYLGRPAHADTPTTQDD
jgi:protein-S-isoprenylcysteine O-methyltransferase Ste14